MSVYAPRAVWDSLTGSGRFDFKLLWYVDSATQPLDLSDRVVEVGDHTRTVSPLFGDAKVGRISVRFDNSDGFFTRRSWIHGRGGRDTHMTAVSVGLQAEGFSIDVYRGFLEKSTSSGPFTTWILQDALTAVLGIDMPALVAMDGRSTPGQVIQDLFTTYTFVQSSDIDSASFAHADEVHDANSWIVWGSIQDATFGEAIAAVARSGLGTVFAGGDGIIRFETEFPEGPWNSSTRTIVEYPGTFQHGINAWNFSWGEDRSMYATEVKINYRGGTLIERDVSREPPRVTKTLRAPYLLFQRSAETAGHVLLQALSEFSKVVQFDTDLRGLTVDLMDRINVVDDLTNTQATYRVIDRKASIARKVCTITGIEFAHENTILSRTPPFTQWATGSWGAGVMF